ncbi:MAG: cytochrome P450 [Acidobacteriaceae bacterium]|nr:cytochrome P450 [Acidobacteriaceae bacterium]MBV9781120.1 cytochrome P450 [Acidobacteriaceae bacterium]
MKTDQNTQNDTDAGLSLFQLLDPEVLANPYPLFRRIRSTDPVHWDMFLHAWVITRYDDVVRVFKTFSADRTPSPRQLSEMGLEHMSPIAALMVKQMLFLDPPTHTRIRSLAACVFTPRRVSVLRDRIENIARRLLLRVAETGEMDVMADFASPLPAIITATLLGVPEEDYEQLKDWSADFAEMLGNFQHNPDRTPRILKTVEEMTTYFRDRIREQHQHPREGLLHSLLTAEVNGDKLSEEEVIANSIITMIGGQETTTNLIGNGLLALLRNPAELDRLRRDGSLLGSAVEELLRYDCPSQHTARIAPADMEMGGKRISGGQAVIAVMAAANRDPERFPDPDRLDLSRADNRHLAFGWASHFCFGAPLARLEGQISFSLLTQLPNLHLTSESLQWRNNLGLRGLVALPVRFDPSPSLRFDESNQR